MAHGLILGQTESGKTTLAKRMSHALKKAGKTVIVLDPFNDPEWAADFQTSDGPSFVEVYWANRECYAFMDEGADTVGKYDEAMRETATKGRHWGHSNFYISQRGASLNATVRAQCRHLWIFTSTNDDSKVLANEFNCPEIRTASALPQGHFFHKARFGPLERGKLW